MLPSCSLSKLFSLACFASNHFSASSTAYYRCSLRLSHMHATGLSPLSELRPRTRYARVKKGESTKFYKIHLSARNAALAWIAPRSRRGSISSVAEIAGERWLGSQTASTKAKRNFSKFAALDQRFVGNAALVSLSSRRVVVRRGSLRRHRIRHLIDSK